MKKWNFDTRLDVKGSILAPLVGIALVIGPPLLYSACTQHNPPEAPVNCAERLPAVQPDFSKNPKQAWCGLVKQVRKACGEVAADYYEALYGQECH